MRSAVSSLPARLLARRALELRRPVSGELWTEDGQTWQRARAMLAGTRTTDGASIVECMHDLCQVLASGIDAAGAGVLLSSPSGAEATAAATDDVTRSRLELELAVGEGPAQDAFRLGRPVLVPDVDGAPGTRWPGWTSVARNAGIGAVFSFPLQLGGSRFGVITVVDDAARRLNGPHLSHALAVAEVATTVLLLGIEGSADETTVGPELVGDLGFRSEVFQAQGMLAVALGISLAAALARLRALAFAEGRDLVEVAREIVERPLATSDDDLPDLMP